MSKYGGHERCMKKKLRPNNDDINLEIENRKFILWNEENKRQRKLAQSTLEAKPRYINAPNK